MKKSLLSILFMLSSIEVFAMEVPEFLEVAGKKYSKKSPLREALAGRPLKIIVFNNIGKDVWVKIVLGRKTTDPKKKKFSRGTGFVYAPGFQKEGDPRVFKLPNNNAIRVNYLPVDEAMSVEAWPVDLSAVGVNVLFPKSGYYTVKLEISEAKKRLEVSALGDVEERDLKIIPTIKYEKVE